MFSLSRTGLLVGSLLFLVSTTGCSTANVYRGPYPASAKAGSEGGQDRYRICHRGRNELTLPEPAVRAHLNHGDSFGSCRDRGRGRGRGQRR